MNWYILVKIHIFYSNYSKRNVHEISNLILDTLNKNNTKGTFNKVRV